MRRPNRPCSANHASTVPGTVTGSGRLTKTGPGTLILAKTNHYSGGTTIDAGTLYLAGATADIVTARDEITRVLEDVAGREH